MVRARSDDDGSNAFSIDEEDDMDALLEAAANAGSAAIDEEEPYSSNDLGITDDEDDLDPKAPAEEIDFGIESDAPFQTTPPSRPPEVVAPKLGTEDEIDALLATIETERLVEATLVEGVAELTDYPAPVAGPSLSAPAYEEPSPLVSEPEPQIISEPELKVEPVELSQEADEVASFPKALDVEDQIALAKRIVATVDVYRTLSAAAKDVVAQLLAPTAEDVTQDEATIAIRAIYAEAIQESTQKALIEAKQSNPVDRVFYVLALPADVLRYLGELVQAYSSEDLPDDGNTLNFAKALVDAIEKLDQEPVVYAGAMAKVLKAAQYS